LVKLGIFGNNFLLLVSLRDPAGIINNNSLTIIPVFYPSITCSMIGSAALINQSSYKYQSIRVESDTQSNLIFNNFKLSTVKPRIVNIYLYKIMV